MQPDVWMENPKETHVTFTTLFTKAPSAPFGKAALASPRRVSAACPTPPFTLIAPSRACRLVSHWPSQLAGSARSLLAAVFALSFAAACNIPGGALECARNSDCRDDEECRDGGCEEIAEGESERPGEGEGERPGEGEGERPGEGEGENECIDDSDCDQNATCEIVAGTFQCVAGEPDDTGETCSENSDCLNNTCLLGFDENGNQTAFGYCTKRCDGFADCPTFWDCVEVGNAIGTYCVEG
jgi:hypothetical protein